MQLGGVVFCGLGTLLGAGFWARCAVGVLGKCLLVLLLGLVYFADLSTRASTRQGFLTSASSLGALLSSTCAKGSCPATRTLYRGVVSLCSTRTARLTRNCTCFGCSDCCGVTDIRTVRKGGRRTTGGLLGTLSDKGVRMDCGEVAGSRSLGNVLSTPRLRPTLGHLGRAASCLCVLRGTPRCAHARSISDLPQVICTRTSRPSLGHIHSCFQLSDMTIINSRLTAVGHVLACVRSGVHRSKRGNGPGNKGGSVGFTRTYGSNDQNLGYHKLTAMLGRYCLSVNVPSHIVAYVPGACVGSYRIVGTICSSALNG